MEQTPSCKYFRLLADEYIEGELTGEEMREFEAHIAKCPECRKEFEELSALKEMLAETDEEIPEGLHERIMSAVSSEIKPRRGRLRLLRRAAISAACAVICLSLTVAFTLMPLWREGTGSGLPEGEITNSSAEKVDVQTDMSFSVNDNAENIPSDESESILVTPESTAAEDRLPEAEPSSDESGEISFAVPESTAGSKIPDTIPETAIPETAKPATEAPIVETDSPATEADAIETPSEIKPAGDDNTSTSLSADADTILTASSEANTTLGGEEITFALLIISGLLAVASFIAFLISLSSVRNTPSKKNREEDK